MRVFVKNFNKEILRASILVILFMLINGLNLNAQDLNFVKARFQGDLDKYIGLKLTYPMDLAFQGVSGFAEIDFHVNKLGKIDSIEVITAPDIRLAEEIIHILMSTKEMWTATQMNGENQNFKYKLIVDYKIIEGQDSPQDQSFVLRDKALKMKNKGRYDAALKFIDKAIVLNPYVDSFYTVRSQIYQSLGDTVQSDLDKKVSEQLERRIIGPFGMVAYGIKK